MLLMWSIHSTMFLKFLLRTSTVSCSISSSGHKSIISSLILLKWTVSPLGVTNSSKMMKSRWFKFLRVHQWSSLLTVLVTVPICPWHFNQRSSFYNITVQIKSMADWPLLEGSQDAISQISRFQVGLIIIKNTMYAYIHMILQNWNSYLQNSKFITYCKFHRSIESRK